MEGGSKSFPIGEELMQLPLRVAASPRERHPTKKALSYSPAIVPASSHARAFHPRRRPRSCLFPTPHGFLPREALNFLHFHNFANFRAWHCPRALCSLRHR